MAPADPRHPDPTNRVLTAPIAAGGLIGGFAVAVATGSRPLGGVVLALCGLTCVFVWIRRDGRRTTVLLTVAGLVAFALSHVLGLVIGAWPAVLVVAAATAGLCWRQSDSRRFTAAGAGDQAPARPATPGVSGATATGSPRTPLRADRRGSSA